MTSLKDLKSLQPLLLAGLVQLGVETVTHYQHDLWQNLGNGCPDIIVETYRGCGRLLGMFVWAAHIAMSAGATDALAFVVLGSAAKAARFKSLADALTVHGLRSAHIEGTDDSTPSIAKGVKLLYGTSGALTRCRDLLGRCETVVFEDVNEMPTEQAADLIELVVKANPNIALCLHARVKPADVDLSIRYLLRRSNRRYLSANPQPSVTYSALLCHDQEERVELGLKLTQLAGFRRILVMTHNKEVRSLRQKIADDIGLNALSIHRGTPAAERQRVLSDFVTAPFAVLVTMDAFTGIDMVDVDAVINYYPPQKSMPDEEWEPFVACLNTTGKPLKNCLVLTIAAPDDLTMMAYFMTKTGVDSPIINVHPDHPDFEDIVSNPAALLYLRGPDAPAPPAGPRQPRPPLAAAVSPAPTPKPLQQQAQSTTDKNVAGGKMHASGPKTGGQQQAQTQQKGHADASKNQKPPQQQHQQQQQQQQKQTPPPPQQQQAKQPSKPQPKTQQLQQKQSQKQHAAPATQAPQHQPVAKQDAPSKKGGGSNDHHNQAPQQHHQGKSQGKPETNASSAKGSKQDQDSSSKKGGKGIALPTPASVALANANSSSANKAHKAGKDNGKSDGQPNK